MSLERISRCVVEEGVAPDVACGFSIRRDGVWRCGQSSPPPLRGGWSASDEVLFDLASVTKPMTAVAFARSGLDRRAPLASVLPELRGTPSADVPLELFLAHRAGLEAHMAIFEPMTRGERVDPAEALLTAARARRADAQGRPPPGGFAPVYSDMSYMLAGAALARHAGVVDAGLAIHRLVLAPLGIDDRVGTARELEARGVDLRKRAAPTEHAAWRGGVVRGRVHDENAWAITGDGGHGHAGLFGTISGVLAFGRAVLDALDGRETPLGKTDLAWLVEERPGGTLRAGFDGKSAEGSSAGSKLSTRSFGHLGFTGTSVWIDPDAKVVVSLLTNRVHPTRDNQKIRAMRPRAHDALYDLATAT